MKQVKHEILDETFHYEILPSGFKLYILPKRGFCKKHAVLTVDFGSTDRSFALPGSGEIVQIPDGVAHYLEHRMFERPEGDVTDQFTALGVEVNAQTGFTSTEYFFSCIDGFEKGLELLLDTVLHLHLTPEGVKREREIIAREIQLYSDHLEWVSFFHILQTLYREHPLGVDIAGTLESIRQIDSEILEVCYKNFYCPSNMGLFVSGDVEIEKTRDQVYTWIENQAFDGGHPIQRLPCRDLPNTIEGPRDAWLPIVQPRLCLGFKDRDAGMQGTRLLRREIALELALDILFGPSSSFFSMHYESGLIDSDSFGYEVYAEPVFGFCLLGGDTHQPEYLEELLIAEIRKGQSGLMIETEFPRVKRKAYGHLLHHLEQVEGCASMMHSAVSRGAQPFDFFEAYEALGPQDVLNCLETWLDPENYGCSFVRPGPGGMN